MIRIYEPRDDAEEFKNHLIRCSWQFLPLPGEALSSSMCDPDFSEEIKDMLHYSDGYWSWERDANKMMVYDAKEGLLYMHKATVLIK